MHWPFTEKWHRDLVPTKQHLASPKWDTSPPPPRSDTHEIAANNAKTPQSKMRPTAQPNQETVAVGASTEALADRKEFWAVGRVLEPLQSGDILGLVVNDESELHLSHNGAAAGMQLCVDASQPLWMLFSLHGAIGQIRLLGSTILAERGIPSLPCSPASTPTSPSALGSRLSDPLLSTCSSGPLGSSAGGTAPNSPVSLPESPVTPGTGQWSDECTICYEHAVDTVIYTCGHMCLCYACGLRLKKALHACCPICRRPVKDIIKTYLELLARRAHPSRHLLGLQPSAS
ncbi:Neuralized-like protein 1A [Myotis brandtii]|uniref:Neuralized-like protein 1A n=1 Tax=Myotis brandtii TaxID=109478 RepID=S7N0W0_MYOBR|nr:Neuralized-like protein 1A [Myotis brandtii]